MLLHLSYKNFLARKITKFYLYNSIFSRKYFLDVANFTGKYFLAVEIFTGKCFLASAKPPSTAPKCPGGAKRLKTALLPKKPCKAFKSNGLQNRAKNFKNLPESQFFGFCKRLIININYLPKFTQIPTIFLPKPTTVEFARFFAGRWWGQGAPRAPAAVCAAWPKKWDKKLPFRFICVFLQRCPLGAMDSRLFVKY